MAEKDIDIRFSAISDPALKEIGKVKSEILSLGVAVLGLKSFKDAVMDVGKFNDALMRTKFSANLTSAELVKLKDSLYSAALQTGQTSDSMLKMGQDALTASKDINFVNKNLKLMGDVSNVIGSSEGVGKFLSELHEKTKLSGKALQDAAFELLSFSQQKGVKISAKDFIPKAGELIEQLHTAMPGASALQFRTALREALFIGKPEEYAAAQKKIFRLMGQSRSFINPMGKEGPLAAMGFSEKQAITVAGVIGRAMTMAGGDTKKAQNILSAAFKGQGLDLSRLIVDYKEYAEAQKNADPTKIAEQANEASHSFESAMNDMKTAGRLFADTELAKPIEELSKWVTNFAKNKNADQIKVWLKEVKDLAIEIGVAFAAWKIFKLGQEVAGGFKGKGGVGGVGLGQLGTITNPMYVIQVGSSGGPGGIPSVGGKGGGVFGYAKSFLSVLGPLLTFAGIAGELGSATSPDEKKILDNMIAKEKANKTDSRAAYEASAGPAGTNIVAYFILNEETIAARLKNAEVRPSKRGDQVNIPQAAPKGWY